MKAQKKQEIWIALLRIAVYYALLAIIVIPIISGMIDKFPMRNFTTIYSLVLSVCLVLYYSHRVAPMGKLSVMMKTLSWMALALIVIQGIKYSAVSEIGILARHAWYLYYVPILMIPLLLFCISLLVAAKDYRRVPKLWYIPFAITLVLMVLVLTNDLHEQAFAFKPNFENWDGDYTRGWLFYVVYVWQFLLSIVAIVIMLVKCSISSSKKNAWILLIPFAAGVVMYVLLLTGNSVVEFPEVHIFTAAVVLECCMLLGLIPTNRDYGKLFQNFSISAQITDKKGTPIYSSYLAKPLTAEQFALESGARIDEHTVLHKMVIAGGFGFWQEDMTEIDRLNDELAEAKDGLAEDVELTSLQNELKEKQTKIEQRMLMYDTIAKRTWKQSQSIQHLAETARESKDATLKERYRCKITLLGAYIKRYANLMLMSEEADEIEIGELGLSISEVLHYLNFSGIPSEFISTADCKISAKIALATFEAFETLIEDNFEHLNGVFVNLLAKENIVFKLTFENLKTPLSRDLTATLADLGVSVDLKQEDNVAYIAFTMMAKGVEL